MHTLGDSTLDTFWWGTNGNGSNAEAAKRATVEGQLEAKLNSDGQSTYIVDSHAYDGFTTSSVLNGDQVGRVLGITKRNWEQPKRFAYLQNRGIGHGDSLFVTPLEDLKTSIAKKPDAIHYVVISVGGNDFRERLNNPIAMLRGIPNVHKRYLEIVDQVKALSGRDIRPILMLQYQLDVNNDAYRIYAIFKIVGLAAIALQSLSFFTLATSALLLATKKIGGPAALIFSGIGAIVLASSRRFIPNTMTVGILKGQHVGLTTLGGLLKVFYRPILERAKQECFPILDLPNTLNPHKPLYTAQIEPNEEGAKLIAEGICHVIKQHDFTSASSLYSKNGTDTAFHSSANLPSDWEVSYPTT